MENDSVPPQLAVGIVYNLKKGIVSDAEDIEAEYDSFETIEAISEAFKTAGIDVKQMEANEYLIDKLRSSPVDIIFNIAEGTSGRGREAQVPAIMNFLGIPYSGSDETTLCIALDKTVTKRYLSTFGIRTPLYQLVKTPDFILDQTLTFPLIVKPNSEGSSKGISESAIAENETQLRSMIERDFKLYDQPMLIEEFISGREFTVGILGNGSDMRIFEPLEICWLGNDSHNAIYSYNVKKNFREYIEYSCPPQLDQVTINGMKRIAAEIYLALECRDFSRIDFRLSERGEIYFIEINPLPGLAPGYSDYPMMAELCGTDYQSLLTGILNSALKRYGMKEVTLNRGA